MASRDKRTTRRRRPRRPQLPAVEEALPRGVLSATAVAIEALRTGVMPMRSPRRREEIPHEDETMLMGDPDDNGLENEYVGDQTPGGSSPTPDQNLIDETGRAYGLQEEEAGELWSAGELLARRDRNRSELRASRRKNY
jgi:hypothetical protein